MAIHIAIFCFVLRPMSEFEVLMTARSLGGRYFRVTNSLETIRTLPDSEIGPC